MERRQESVETKPSPLSLIELRNQRIETYSSTAKLPMLNLKLPKIVFKEVVQAYRLVMEYLQRSKDQSILRAEAKNSATKKRSTLMEFPNRENKLICRMLKL